MLEKILKEIEQRVSYYRDNATAEYADICAGLREAQDIIRRHMNDGWIPVTERLQDISGGELLKEGIDKSILFDGNVKNAFDRFRELWNSTIKKSDLAHYGWEASPWVWVIEFERAEPDK